jgi:hypothetical protein
MNNSDDYYKDGSQHDCYLGGVYTLLKSGGLRCNKCGNKISDKEMFCLKCFGRDPVPRARKSRIPAEISNDFPSIRIEASDCIAPSLVDKKAKPDG